MATKLTTITAKPSSRLLFIDNLRTGLITLVVLHHVAAVYGAFTPFYYLEPPINSVLLVFALINQSWFMGTLFLLSGYFTPGSFDRKGPGPFLKDRLLRLGVPLIMFTFVLSPVSFIGLWQMPASLTGITTPLTWKAYPLLLGMGPLWFVAMLLIFDFCYTAWRMLTKNRISHMTGNSSLPNFLLIGIFILVLAGASYLLRIVVPIGKKVIGFPTIAYFPQYLSFFILGAYASRRNWFLILPSSMGLVGFVTALVVGVLLFPLAFSGHLFSLELTPGLNNSLGNGHWQSAVYTLWDSTFAVGICLSAIALFRSFFGVQRRFGRFLSQHSYTVYIIHIPIIVLLAVTLRRIDLEPLLKFGVAGTIAVPTCFAVAFMFRKIPLVSRIL
jgi:hypothetical protein